MTEKKGDKKEFKKYFREFFNNSFDLAFVYDSKGNFLEVNNSISKILGYPKKELLQMKLIDIITSNSLVKFKKENLFKKKSATEVALNTKKGKTLLVGLDIKTLTCGSKAVFLGVARDISQRVKTEKKLKEERDKYEFFAERAVNVIWRFDKKLNFTYINQAVYSSLGYTPKEVLGTNLSDYCSKKEFAKMSFYAMKAILKPKEYPVANFEANLIHKKGHEIPVEITGKTIYDDEGKFFGLQGVIRKLTEMKRLEKTYKDLFDKMVSGVAVYEPVKEGRNFKVVDLNKAGEKISGVRVYDIKGKLATEAFPGIKKMGLLKALKKVYKKGEPLDLPAAAYSEKDEVRWFHNYIYRVNTGEIVAIYRDVTEENLYYERLVESENKFRHLFENMKSGVVTYKAINKGKDFVFKELNRTAEDIYKVDRWKIAGKKITEVFPWAKKEGLLDTMQNVYKTKNSKFLPIKLYEKGKIINYWENYIYKSTNDELVVVYDDLTEKKKAEVQLKEKVEELEKINKFTIGRELKMIQLKEEIKELESRLATKLN
jgi:PAS domain S-box-containing protein